MTEFEWTWFDYLARLEVEVMLFAVDRQRLLDERTRFGKVAAQEIEVTGLMPVISRIFEITMMAHREAECRVRFTSPDKQYRQELVAP